MLLSNGVGNKANSACDAVTQSYTDGVNDEFVVPTVDRSKRDDFLMEMPLYSVTLDLIELVN